jgi:hypothetical protein
MPRIKLIVTGDMEKQALHKSLRRLFPRARAGEVEEVVWEPPRKLHGATSHQLVAGKSPSRPMRALAQAMLDEVTIGKTGTAADLVVIIEDVELGNLEQVGVVTQHFREAMRETLWAHVAKAKDQERERVRDHCQALLREKCSFHLLHPMVEAYLFGDASALGVAGVPAEVSPKLVHSDVERFETDDPLWLPICQSENVARQTVAPWWRHERHPKHYLAHLAERGGVFYEETDHGKNALLSLGWSDIPSVADEVAVIRALFEDIAAWFGVPNPLGVGDLHAELYPGRSIARAGLLLRNM